MMPRLPQFLFDFKRTVEAMLRGNRRLSLRHFIDEYDYDDFLEGEATQCTTPRALASAFACRFLTAVPPEYVEALSVALVAFLAECGGRMQLNPSDFAAVKSLATLPQTDEKQFGLWMDAYFRDVS
jgi:hypothetical protein